MIIYIKACVQVLESTTAYVKKKLVEGGTTPRPNIDTSGIQHFLNL